MGFDVFKVEIQSNVSVFFSGQQIQGFVRAVTATEVACREISVELRGKGKVHWTEHRNKRTYTYSNEEVYTRKVAVVWHGEGTGNRIEGGNHVFPFHFTLDNNLPSSFETTNGEVKYSFKAVADIPWSMDQVDKCLFIVHNIFDLNMHPQSRDMVHLLGEDTAGSMCCKSGPIRFDMQVNRKGYVPGEVMTIDGTISNYSLSAVKYTEAKIVQTLLLRATDKIKVENVTVQRVYRPSIRPGGEDTWSRVPLLIPAVSPSELQYCNIIDISYNLQILAKIGCCKSACVAKDILIGSVALRRDGMQVPVLHHGGTEVERRLLEQSMGPRLPLPSAPDAQNYNAPIHDSPPPYPESEPPTYEEYRHMKETGKDQKIPKYFDV